MPRDIVAERRRATARMRVSRRGFADRDVRQHLDTARRAIVAAETAHTIREAYGHLRKCAQAAFRAAGLLRKEVDK